MRTLTPDTEQPELTPSEDYTDYSGCLAWHSQFTIMSTAIDICCLELFGTTDTPEVEPEPKP